MDTQRDLLFGLLAYQKGAIESDCLAETCAADASDRTVPIGDQLVDQGRMTIEQKLQLEQVLEAELAKHGGDVQATIAANLDVRAAQALRNVPSIGEAVTEGMTVAYEPSGPVLIGSLGAEDHESRERYTLTHLYAKGGMGQVWLAHDPALGREIALKELRPDQANSESIRERFLAEAQVTAQLEHPGIVPVYELGNASLPYYTMRFIKGGTLSQASRSYHKRRKNGDADQVDMVRLLGAFVGICNALAYAHSRGFIHRDLKGQNVVLGDFGEVIVLDWGLAKRIAPSPDSEPKSPPPDQEGHRTAPLADTAEQTVIVPETKQSNGAEAASSDGCARVERTLRGQLLGTPAFMAPEQAEGRQDLTDARTDVYGLGAILYELLTGQPPYNAKSATEILRKVRTKAPKPPRQVNPQVDPALQAVCLKALSRQPEDRYATAAELAREVQRFLADEPVLAWPEPWTRRASRWARKHRTAVAVAGSLLLATTAGLAISTTLISRERDKVVVQEEIARTAVDDMYVKVAENLLEDRSDPLQRELLQKALDYYEKFTSDTASTPKVRLEHGQAYRRMGEIYRKLGRFDDADRSFRKALDLLRPLAANRPDDREVQRVLALTQSRLGDFLFRAGKLGEAETQLKEAAEVLDAQATQPSAPRQDRLWLARTLRTQGELMRRDGHLASARSLGTRACELLEEVLAADPQSADVRQDLAQANDVLGRAVADLGDSAAYEKAFRRAYELLDSLIASLPTVPRYRESMAHVCNGLGEFERKSSRVADCEAHWRRMLKETERLAEDFPGRPEYQRLLAGSCSNLGGILAEQGRPAEGEPILRRGVALDLALLKSNPNDQEVRYDLGVCHYNLGYLAYIGERYEQAVQLLETSCKYLAELPGEQARARRVQAMAQGFLGDSLEALRKDGAQQAYQRSVDLLEKLTAETPDHIPYQIELAQSLNKLAGKLAELERHDEAESAYQRALTTLDLCQKKEASRPARLEKVISLNNLALFRHNAHLPGGEATARQSIELAKSLASTAPPAAKDHQYLALSRNNLGEILRELGRFAEARSETQAAINEFQSIVAAAPESVQDRYYLGYAWDQQGKTLLKRNELNEARLAFKEGAKRLREALKLSEGKSELARLAMLGTLQQLAEVTLSLHDDQGTIDAAVELAQAAPTSVVSQLDAARFLARCALRVQEDARLSAERKDELGRESLGRAVVMLRQAVELDPKVAAAIPEDTVFKELLNRPAYRSMIESLVKVERGTSSTGLQRNGH